MNNRRARWGLALAVTAGLSVGGFWVVLGYRYSPENYSAQPVAQGLVEQVWLGVALVVAVLTAVHVWADGERLRRVVLGSLPLAVAGAWELGSAAAGRALGCGDALWFSAACGFTAWRLALRGVALVVGERRRLLSALVWAGGLALAGYFLWQQTRYFNNLALGYDDCGSVARMMFNTLHHPRELFLRTNPDRPLFGDHFQPGILPFALGWLVWPRLEVTILFQVLAIVGTAWPMYLLGKEVAKDRTGGLLLAALWLVYPSTSQMIYKGSYGFYWGNFCLPLYVFALWLWLRGRGGWALLVVAWAILIKEEAAVFVGMFGLYLALFEKRRVAGTALCLGGLAYFWVMTSVVIPALNGASYQMLTYFSELGASHREILLSPLTRPQVFWGKIFEPATFYLLGCWLVPLLFLPLKRPAVLLIGSLPFLFICLWSNPNWKSICFQYQSGLLVVLFWAMAETQRPDPVRGPGAGSQAALLGAVAGGIVLSIFLGSAAWSKDSLFVREFPGRLARLERLARPIDPNGTLVATQRAAAHFVTQRYLYLVPDLPVGTDYVLLDLRDGWRGPVTRELLSERRRFQLQVERVPTLKLLARDDGLVLYGRGGAPLDARAAIERERLPEGITPTRIPLGAGIEVLGLKLEHLNDGQVRVRTFSAATRPVRADLAARCGLRFSADEQYVSTLQPLGQGIWPTVRWQPGKFYEDEFIISVPVSLRGQPCQVVFAAEDLKQASSDTEHRAMDRP